MIKHIVFWTLKESADGRDAHGNALELKSRLEPLADVVPGIIRLEVGIDVGRTPASADVALYSEFADAAALDAYQEHPEHVAVAEWLNAVRESRAVVDYEA